MALTPIEPKRAESRGEAAPDRILKIAVVGCGKIADLHVEEILKIPAVKLAGLCDQEPLMAEQLAVRYKQGEIFGDMNRMIEKIRPDVIHITTPPQSHLFLARNAFNAGCHVVLEKPTAMNVSETAEIIAIARDTGKLLTVNYIYLFDPAAIRLRRLVSEGYFGDILHMESFFGYNLTGTFGSALLRDKSHWVHALPGKLLHNVLDHLINKIVDLLPCDAPIRVQAAGLGISKAAKEDPAGQFFDELRATLTCGDVTAYATFSSSIRPIGHFLRVYGTKGSATVDLNVSTISLHRSPTLPSAIGRLIPPFEIGIAEIREGFGNIGQFIRSQFHFSRGLNTLLSSFYEGIRNNGSPPLPYERILRVAEVMDAIFHQVKKKI